MSSTLTPLAVTVSAVVLLLCGVFALTAVLGGHVFHSWGTRSALEWTSEAMRRPFYRSLRQRFMRRVNRQSQVGVDGTRRASPYIAMSVSPSDVTALAGIGGTLSTLAAAAANGLARYGRAEGWAADQEPQVVVLPEEWLRRGAFRGRPVSRQEFLELKEAMHAWESAHLQPLSMTRQPQRSTPTSAPPRTTGVGADGDAPATPPDLESTEVLAPEATEVLASAPTLDVRPRAPQIVLTDARGVRHTITSTSVRIGRAHTSDIALDSVEVSREHASIYYQEGDWWLRDRGSRNGTTLDGGQVRGTGPAQLKPGSRIVLGSGEAAPRLTVTDLAGG